jgi:uncharacterized protein YecE (DUF72 family)
VIRVGVGGWTFAPWRGPFYPKGLPHAGELAHASRQLTAIEINGTFYRTQSPASFAKWRDETPDGFMFTVKGHRSVTNRAKLAEAESSIAFFLNSGVAELGPKLGPILWQLAPNKKFNPDDLDAFLALLPPEVGGLKLRHAIEVRHESFVAPEFVAIARRHNVAIVYADHETYPAIADDTGPFVYARLQRASLENPDGYAPDALDAWAERFKRWQAGDAPPDLPRLEPSGDRIGPRDCFVFFISGDKVRAPAAATALIARLG